MSIVALALRMSAVRALQSAGTLAGERWFDSALLPIDKIAGDEPAPFGSVSTEDENDKPSGRDLNAGSRTIDLVIEIGIAQIVSITIPPAQGGGEEEVAQIVASDAMLELSLAYLGRQISATLWGRGGGLWGDAFRALAGNIQTYVSRRGIPVKDGQRFAARQMGFTIQPIAEPEFGKAVPAGSPLAKFLGAADADAVSDPTFAPIVAIIRKAIEGLPMGWPEFWTASALAGGYTEAEGDQIGIVPLGGYPAEALEEINIEPDGWTLDETAADINDPVIPDE